MNFKRKVRIAIFREIAVSPVACYSALYLNTTQFFRMYLVFDVYCKL